MCGAGVLPARVAPEARRRGYRVVAFTFGDAPGLDGAADRVIPSSVSNIAAVLDGLSAERVSTALFIGTFRTRELLRMEGDALGAADMAPGGWGLSDAELIRGVVALLDALGIEVLDQRAFFGDWIAGAGLLGRIDVTDGQRDDISRGLRVARQLCAAGVGQTVVLKRGLVASVEASEGTTEAIRRGLSLTGPGAVVVKAVALDNDYRFDVPAVGPETIEVMVAGRAGALAIEAGRVLVLERARTVEMADGAEISVVSVPVPDR